MTRFLSEALQAPEPFFRLALQRLEQANGQPKADIRFSTDVLHGSQLKLRQLGLDPHDTTAAELYHVLQERVKADDQRLNRKLRTAAATHVSAEADVVAGMVHTLQGLPDSMRCFALKASSFKAIIKKHPPKRAMKQLGYRSVESFLKHESMAAALAAGWLADGNSWQQKLSESYKKLQPKDFENRNIAIVHPTSKRWQKLAQSVVAQNRHYVLSFKEAGALVLLPLPHHAPSGSTTASLSLALHELNEIRAASTFLKLCQVRNDFGKVVKTIAGEEPQLQSQLLDQPVPWHLIQRYYARLANTEAHEVIEPHIQLEDMSWHPVEDTLALIDSHFEFWKESAHLGLVDGRKAVSLNIVDAALNCCNQLPFERRIVHYFQRSLWHELLLRYFQHESVERTVMNELQPQLATEVTTA
jgi:hypothetical protein